MTKENSPGPLFSLLEACSYSLYIQGHFMLGIISLSGWATIGNHLNSGRISAVCATSQIQASTSDEPPVTTSLVGRWEFLSSAEVGSYDHPIFPLNANMWISVSAGPDAFPEGVCSSSLVTVTSVSAHLTCAGREKVFLPLPNPTNFHPSTWQSQSSSHLDIASKCPSFQAIQDFDPAPLTFLQTILYFFLSSVILRSLLCSPPPTALLPGSSVPQPELPSHLQGWDPANGPGQLDHSLWHLITSDSSAHSWAVPLDPLSRLCLHKLPGHFHT